ncbi:MAG: thiolase C-terminal domain-containing protein [Acidimicrobiales bacterium]
MISRNRSPCLIGVGTRTWHPEDCGSDGAPEPLLMWETVARAAAIDALGTTEVDDALGPVTEVGRGPGDEVLRRTERLDVVYCQSWQYDEPAARLAGRIGAEPRRAVYSGIGGTVPQMQVCEAARDIMTGDLDLALVVGGEALATRRRLAKRGDKPRWSFPPEERRPFPFDIPFDPGQISHGIFEAWLTFALFDNANRAHLGTDLAEHRRSLGELLAPMTVVAASDPESWFPIERGVEEIVGPSPTNRMVGYPYSKLMTAIMDVDMAAAVLVASQELADSIGVPPERRVYLRGWGSARDPDTLAGRADLWRSGAMAAASTAALAGAGAGVDDVAHLDLYSCFPSSLTFALDALGVDPGAARSAAPNIQPSRPVTATGGLAYYGGPGSNYMTHSLAKMTRRLRADPGAIGLVSGVGMHMNKHVFAAYSAEPGDLEPPDDAAVTIAAAMQTRPLVEGYEGAATIATYSVVHGRDGDPEWAPLVCNLPSTGGSGPARCYARMEDADDLRAAETTEVIGKPVHLVSDGERTIARLSLG